MAEMLSTNRIAKRFGATDALKDISFGVAEGEIRALCGENGAGKSTFVKILTGVYRADSGSIRVNGALHDIRSPQQAQSVGLALVAQELSLAPHLSVLDNIWLGNARVPLFHRRQYLREEARRALQMLGAEDYDLDRPVAALALGQRQIVEIARLIAREARLLILDEPTATLSDVEIAHILVALKALKAQNRSVIYITHRLGEVFEVCDSVSVFRNGEHVKTDAVGKFDRTSLIESILGRSFSEMYPAKATAVATSTAAFTVNGLNIPGVIADFSMVAPPGKIVCIAGQLGSGAHRTIRALAGLDPDASGDVRIGAVPMALGSRARARARGVLFVSDDRGGEGIFPNRAILENLVANRLAIHSRLGILSWPALRAVAARMAKRVKIDPTRLGASALDLSGGNQQKLLFARGLDQVGAGVLLMNEPTRGVDVGARGEIYRLMREFCDAGYSLVMTSTDLEEVVGMADIVITLFRGRTIASYEGSEISMRAILADITHPNTEAAAA
jgi:ribose transport system ATP-binding protein/rhamnose transport system ATP-binding protein